MSLLTMAEEWEMFEQQNVKNAREVAGRGAAWLDRVRPDWFRSVDIGTMEITSDSHCVMAQVEGRSWEMCELPDALAEEMYAEDTDAVLRSHGFMQSVVICTPEALDEAWVKEINTRLHR